MISNDLMRVKRGIESVNAGVAIFALELPLSTKSEANQHEHWRIRAKRASGHRLAVTLALGPYVRGHAELLKGPLVVVMTRISPRALDSDNLAGSTKHVRDAIADCFRVDDKDPRIVWLVDQRRGKTSLEIEVYPMLPE